MFVVNRQLTKLRTRRMIKEEYEGLLDIPSDLWIKCFGTKDLWRFRLVNKLWHKLIWENLNSLRLSPESSFPELQHVSQYALHVSNLDLCGCSQFTGDGLSLLSSLTNLLSLDLSDIFSRNNAEKDQKILFALSRFTRLQKLEISISDPFHTDIDYFPSVSSLFVSLRLLTHLSINYCFHLNYLPYLSNLKHLEFVEIKLFSSMDSLPRLLQDRDDNNLYCDDTFHEGAIPPDLSSYSFIHLSSPNLETLIIDLPREFQMKSLSHLTNLKSLSCIASKSQDNDFANALLHLTKLSRLTCPRTLNIPMSSFKELKSIICPSAFSSLNSIKWISCIPNLQFLETDITKPETIKDLLPEITQLKDLISLRVHEPYRCPSISSLKQIPKLKYLNGVSVESDQIPQLLIGFEYQEEKEKMCTVCRYPLNQCDCKYYS